MLVDVYVCVCVWMQVCGCRLLGECSVRVCVGECMHVHLCVDLSVWLLVVV